MLKEERLNYILTEVKKRNRVLLIDLATTLNVSEDTVRRDLKQLDEEGKIKKVHGGAISISYHPYTYKENEIYAHESKSIIAQKAISLLKDGQVILMSGGTTNLELARLLPDTLMATVFTPSLPIAMQLLSHPHVETVFVGGRLSREAQIALGGETLSMLSGIRADICFLGTGNLDAEHGLTEFDWEVVQLKKVMIKAARRVAVLTISEKLNSSQRFKVCDTSEISVLVTELDPPGSAAIIPFMTKGLTVL